MFVRSPRLMIGLVAWIIVGVSIGPSFAAAFEGATSAGRIAVAAALWVSWAGVITAMAVPATVSLTAVRLIEPGAIVLIGGSVVRGAAVGDWIIPAVAIAIASIGAFTADFGQLHVQGSAYGDEQRWPLRPPGWVPLVIALWWTVTMTLVVTGIVALTSSPLGATNLLGLIALVVGIGSAWRLVVSAHQLARRWLVLVPAGLVVHDRLGLAETVMVSYGNVAGVAAAEVGTTALDLTVAAPGLAVEIVLREPHTVVTAGRLGRPGGESTTATAILVVPTRPGRFLASYARSRSSR